MKTKFYKLVPVARQALFALAVTLSCTMAYSQTFVYTGSLQTVSLPAGNYSIACWGADGGTVSANTALPGRGGYSSGAIALSAPATFSVYVGGKGNGGAQPLGGFNSGNTTTKTNTGTATGGGGASDVRVLADDFLHRIIVAGGGGGQGTSTGTGGHGGGLNGQNGQGTTNAGVGGSQNAPGLYPAGGDAKPATFGEGGDGPAGTTGGQGGGGWYGGSFGTRTNGGGAGGSGYVLTSTSFTPTGYFSANPSYYFTNTVTAMSGTTGFVANPDLAGNGRVIITALCNLSMVNSAASGPICSGGSATLTSNGISNYAWSTGATTGTIIVSPTITTQYTLTAMSPQSCTTSAVITVSVINSPPTLNAVVSSSAVCAGGPVILTASGASTYTWTNGVNNAISYTPTATNLYTVTGQNACGFGTAMVGVTVNPSPVVLGGVSNSVVCNGSSVTFTSGGSATSYIWTQGVVSGTPYFPSATSNYTLTGSANGCSSITVVGVTVLVTPAVPPVVTPSAICVGETATLSSVGASGYTWSPGTNPNTSTIAVSPAATTNYSVVRTNGICSSTMAVNLVVNPLPLVMASANPNQICAGSGVNLIVLGPISNTWLPGGFTSSNFTLFPNSTTCYSVTGSNGNCTATAAICVTVNPTPPITITSPTNTICEGQSVTLTAGGAQTYTWLASGSNGTTETVSPPTTTLISVSGSNSFGCSANTSQLILVNAIPNMSLTSSVSYLCAGNTAVLSIANPSLNVTYSWSNGPLGVSNPVTPTVSTSYTATGINNITGCTASNNTMVAVYISTFVVNAPSAICNGQTATLSVSGAATSYSWNINGGIFTPTVTIAPVVNTTYILTGINGSCQNTAAVTVTVNPLPNVTATVSKGQICKFEIASITAGGASTYTWDTGSNAATITFTLGVTTTYTLTGTDSKGCSKTTTVTQFVATCIGVQTIENDGAAISIYPNPNNGNFIFTAAEGMTFDIINAIGQVITTIKLSDGMRKEVTVDNLPTGIYIIRSQTHRLKMNKKLIIER